MAYLDHKEQNKCLKTQNISFIFSKSIKNYTKTLNFNKIERKKMLSTYTKFIKIFGSR
jgi:hypothetical protein